MFKEVFTFWEFMDPIDDIEDRAQEFLWDEIDEDVLVFRNSGIPPIVNFGDDEPEEIDVTVFKPSSVAKLPDGWKRYKSRKSKDYYYRHEENDISQWEIPEDSTTEIEMIQTVETKIINKKRVFGETILDGRYEMVGAAILQGTTPGEEGGVHYVAYVNTLEGWYFYNDDGSVWTSLEKFPKKVLKEKYGDKPEMYFYQRVR